MLIFNRNCRGNGRTMWNNNIGGAGSGAGHAGFSHNVEGPPFGAQAPYDELAAVTQWADSLDASEEPPSAGPQPPQNSGESPFAEATASLRRQTIQNVVDRLPSGLSTGHGAIEFPIRALVEEVFKAENVAFATSVPGEPRPTLYFSQGGVNNLDNSEHSGRIRGRPGEGRPPLVEVSLMPKAQFFTSSESRFSEAKNQLSTIPETPGQDFDNAMNNFRENFRTQPQQGDHHFEVSYRTTPDGQPLMASVHASIGTVHMQVNLQSVQGNPMSLVDDVMARDGQLQIKKP